MIQSLIHIQQLKISTLPSQWLTQSVIKYDSVATIIDYIENNNIIVWTRLVRSSTDLLKWHTSNIWHVLKIEQFYVFKTDLKNQYKFNNKHVNRSASARNTQRNV